MTKELAKKYKFQLDKNVWVRTIGDDTLIYSVDYEITEEELKQSIETVKKEKKELLEYWKKQKEIKL